MIPNPIRKVLSSIRKHEVNALLMGGQACGAGEPDSDAVSAALQEEEREERARDVAYWEPLRSELERLRRG